MPRKLTTTVRLSEEARRLLQGLSDHHALSHTAILEIAIREKARRDKVRPSPPLSADDTALDDNAALLSASVSG